MTHNVTVIHSVTLTHSVDEVLLDKVVVKGDDAVFAEEVEDGAFCGVVADQKEVRDCELGGWNGLLERGQPKLQAQVSVAHPRRTILTRKHEHSISSLNGKAVTLVCLVRK